MNVAVSLAVGLSLRGSGLVGIATELSNIWERFFAWIQIRIWFFQTIQLEPLAASFGRVIV